MTYEELVDQWLLSAQMSMGVHYEAAQLFESRHYWIGIPALTLATVVGTTVFAVLKKDVDITVQLATGGASLLAAVLTALQTFLGYSGRAAKHHAAGASYAALVRQIHEELAFPSDVEEDQRRFVEMIRLRFDTLSKESPSMPPRLLQKALSSENPGEE